MLLQWLQRVSSELFAADTPASMEAGVFSFVPEEGLEPSRSCEQLILSQSRLPFRHSGIPVVYNS